VNTDYRDTLCTSEKTGQRKWVYPTIVNGQFRKVRRWVAILLIANYLLLPWIPVGDDQAIRFDILHREFHIFGALFRANDTLYLFLLLGTAAFSLFFFTALLGRVWCGWACPQTVFQEFLFRPIEFLLEGNAAARRKNDQAPWTTRKFVRKAIKVAIFAFLAWFLASTTLAYFVGRRDLIEMIQGSPLNHPVLFAANTLLAGGLLFQFGWFREQFCSVLCPYARFQSVLMDRNSLAVSYHPGEGEPRGKPGPDKGACTDCGLCVRVCPTGIDIRNGLQLECIQCTSCIDACTQTMAKIGRGGSLVRYSTENVLEGQPYLFVRPRVFVYAAILSAYLCAFTALLTQRGPADFHIVRSTGEAPYEITADGKIMNHFKVHLVNRTHEPGSFSAELLDAPFAEVVVPIAPFPVAPDSEGELPLFIRFKPELLHRGRSSVALSVRFNGHSVRTKIIPLLGPEV
jgi:cytochrome c oxidase accessory protein FixG